MSGFIVCAVYGEAMMTDDATLLRNYARERSEEAFNELVERHFNLVYAAALRRTCNDVHRAKDIAQVVFSTLARDAETLSRHIALTGWLYTATRNAAIDVVRAEQRRRQREERAYIMTEPSTEAHVGWDRLRPVLDDAIDQLEERDRLAVLLRFFDGRSFGSVAETLGISEEAARKRVHRALEKLGEVLGRRGITSTGGALALLLANQPAVAVPVGIADSIAAIATLSVTSSAATSAIGVGWTGLFMISAKTVATLATAVAAVAVGSAIYNTKVARASPQVSGVAIHERDGLKTNHSTPPENSRQTSEQAIPAEQSIAAASATSPKTPAVPVEMTKPTEPLIAVAISSAYGSLFRQLNLSPDERSEFTGIFVEWKTSNKEILSAAISRGLPLGDELNELIQSFTTPIRDQKLSAVLGDRVLEALQRFDAELPLRLVATDLALAVSRLDKPLSAAQTDEVIAVLAANTPVQNGRFFVPAMNIEEVITQTSTLLEPDQISLFRSALEILQRSNSTGAK